jgi:hypothetical protein
MDKLQPNTIVDRHGEHPSIESYNWYFSLRKDLPYVTAVPFSNDIDPKGILAHAAGTTYIHADINVVSYYSDSKNCPNVWHFLIVCGIASYADQTEPKCWCMRESIT